MNPDIVEDISRGDALDQRNTIGYAKRFDGEMVVVAAIGGKQNPSLIAQEILKLTDVSWSKSQKAGKTLKELIYQGNDKRPTTADEIAEIKKNRVTAVRRESVDSFAPTSETIQHSPLSDKNISYPDSESNRVKEKPMLGQISFSVEQIEDRLQLNLGNQTEEQRELSAKAIKAFTNLKQIRWSKK